MADLTPASLRRTRIATTALPPGAVLIDQTRERTSWSEGMFVTAQHFNRDQSYVIARQSDLAQAIGRGVIEGLEVTQSADDPTALIVGSGLGLGGGGESILLHASVRLSLADIALQRALTRSAGLEQSLQLISESRTGLFVLCATPVEYTSSPVASYATTPGGQRRLEDSVVNEATLFTLVPYTLSLPAGSAEARRANAARRIFVDRKLPDIPPAALPLAMVELDGNVLVWLDMHLVRQDAGVARADAFGIGAVDTPSRIAHFRQYEAMLDEMVTGAPGLAFAAAARFEVLPPMARMPAACVAPRIPAPGLDPVLSHNWLPAEMPVELVALPEDEIDQLLEESLTLPPIDLRAGAETLRQTPVSIIVPIARADWATAPAEVVQQALSLAPAAPLGAAPQTPLELIATLVEQERDAGAIDPTVSAEWLALLAGRTTLWYARRRQFSRTDALIGEAFQYQIDPPEEGGGGPPASDRAAPVILEWNDGLRAALRDLGLVPFYDRIATSDDAEGRMARRELNAVLAELLGAGSPVAATDALHRALAEGTLAPGPMRTLLELHREHRTGLVFAPVEGLLTGGLVDFEIAPFRGRTGPPRISASFARTLNRQATPVAAETRPVPDDMAERVTRLLQLLDAGDEAVETTLRRGGGLVPIRDPRSLQERMAILRALLELDLPFFARLREPGTVEAQTRRNLLARAGTVPDLVRAFAATKLGDLAAPLFDHMRVVETVFEGTATQAIDLVTETSRAIVEAGRP